MRAARKSRGFEKIFVGVLYGFLVLNWFTVDLRSFAQAQLLPEEEVQVLQTISLKLQNPYWNVISRSSCINGTDFNRNFTAKEFSMVNCNCSSTVCHVTHILLKGLNLRGILPAEFANLTHLEEIDLSRNYINGSIPPSFGQLHLIKLSLLGNRIGGTIPKEIGGISTLEELVLEDNQLEGPLEPNLGSLSNLRRLQLSANNFSGPIPETFGNLKNLTYFMIDGSAISGKIPDFIGNWTRLTRLDMQGTQLQGPFPPAFSLLKNIEQLRVTGLGGSNLSFPGLEYAKKMNLLILRNCSIVGWIPDYIGNMSTLRTLDLSYNNLNGPIPSSFEKFVKERELLSKKGSCNVKEGDSCKHTQIDNGGCGGWFFVLCQNGWARKRLYKGLSSPPSKSSQAEPSISSCFGCHSSPLCFIVRLIREWCENSPQPENICNS